MNKSIVGFNKSGDILIGGIAHELCHVLSEIEFATSTSFFDKLMYKLSSTYRTMDERNTDLQVIIRGYGRQLYEFMNYCDSQELEYYESDGLSTRELIKLLNIS